MLPHHLTPFFAAVDDCRVSFLADPAAFAYPSSSALPPTFNAFAVHRDTQRRHELKRCRNGKRRGLGARARGFQEACSMNEYDLNDRVAIVTGAAQGIGLSVTNRILASGGKVALWDRDQDLLGKTVARARRPRARLHRRYRRSGCRRSRHRGNGRPLRQDRYSRQQCRDRRTECEHLGISAGSLSRRRQCRADRHLLLLPRRRSAHDRGELRTHRQCQLGRRQGRQSESTGLQFDESGGDGD